MSEGTLMLLGLPVSAVRVVGSFLNEKVFDCY